MKRPALGVSFTWLVVAIATTAFGAAPVTVKLATLAPAGSSWHRALNELGDTWAKGTDGRVKLTVYAGGSQGDETSTIRMMRPGVDQLQAALLMIGGLGRIDDAFNVFGIPFFFQSDEEELAVQQKLTPMIAKRVEAKGFHLLMWGNGGWVQLFSKKPVKTLDDVKQVKLFTGQGDDRMVQWYKANGFHPVALSATEIVSQLKLPTGMIDAAPTPPYPALVLQIFRDAKFMLDLRVAPLIGALVVTNEAWNKISPEDRAKMTEAAQAMEKRLQAEAPKQDADSIVQMQARGLTVTKLDAKAAAEFRAAAEKLVATMRGGMVPTDVYDLAQRERDAFRKSKSR